MSQDVGCGFFFFCPSWGVKRLPVRLRSLVDSSFFVCLLESIRPRAGPSGRRSRASSAGSWLGFKRMQLFISARVTRLWAGAAVHFVSLEETPSQDCVCVCSEHVDVSYTNFSLLPRKPSTWARRCFCNKRHSPFFLVYLFLSLFL